MHGGGMLNSQCRLFISGCRMKIDTQMIRYQIIEKRIGVKLNQEVIFNMSQFPYGGIHIIERSLTLSGRLAGVLFADQGAEVRFARQPGRAGEQIDDYLDRGKFEADPAALRDTLSADIIIVDGDAPVDRRPDQIVLRITAALPGDEVYGYLKADCSEDLLSATLGLFTDMALTARVLGRPVIYTPLPISSVYAGVNAAVAVAGALQRRLQSGLGSEVITSRLAGGLSAIGALALTTTGLAPHLSTPPPAGVPAGMTLEQFFDLLKEAAASGERQSWLEHRVIPVGVPYRAADGRMIMIMTGANRRATRKLFDHLGIWGRLKEAGLVDVSPYDPSSIALRGRNIADPGTLNFASMSVIAGLLEEIIATKTAAEWETEFCGGRIAAAAQVMSYEEWLHDPEARRAGLTVALPGSSKPQIGRSAWLASAQPYPPPRMASPAAIVPAHLNTTPANAATDSIPLEKPLQGITVVDLTNVIAGPNCSRMMAELGATVYRVEQPAPYHVPVVTAVWGAESGAGKQSIILDTNTADGKEVLNKMLVRADFVVTNKTDAQCVRLGVDADTLQRINPKTILVQITAHNGERYGGRHDYPGYDPAAQAITGIMLRFGPEGCPTYHGLASCVDYLCGYLGAWAGLTALYARERRGDGRGDWAQTSLTAAASLTQLLLQFQEAPAGMRGPLASGPSATKRIYKAADGWIFALSQTDLTKAVEKETVEKALADLKTQGIEAVRINTVRELADGRRDGLSRTIRFQAISHDGLTSECFVPSWFCFNGVTAESRQIPVRMGASADEILKELGYSQDGIVRLKQRGVVLGTEWRRE